MVGNDWVEVEFLWLAPPLASQRRVERKAERQRQAVRPARTACRSSPADILSSGPHPSTTRRSARAIFSVFTCTSASRFSAQGMGTSSPVTRTTGASR